MDSPARPQRRSGSRVPGSKMSFAGNAGPEIGGRAARCAQSDKPFLLAHVMSAPRGHDLSIESGAGGHRQHHLISAFAALLLATVAVPAQVAATAAAAAQTQSDQQSQQDIIITAPPLFRDIRPERELDELGIESYGVSTVDELIGNLEAELGEDGDEPLIVVNGQKVNDLSEIGAFPVEVLRNIQVLPRGSAVRAGGTPAQRVISITLRRRSKTATLTAAHKFATDGNWNAERGEGIVTDVKGKIRANVSLRGRDEDSLLESQRGIIQPVPSSPFAVSGNVVAPFGTGEIDPLLSALAGEVVTMTSVPSVPEPTLTDFVANANNPAMTDLGEVRTLRPQTRNYDLNGSFAAPIAPWLDSSTTIRLSRNQTNSLRGLPGAIFILAATNPASPFSRNVGLAFYGTNPLRSRSRYDNGELSETLNAKFGLWAANFNAKRTESRNISLIERQAVFGSIPLDDSIDPFVTDLTDLIVLQSDRTSSRNIVSLGQLLLNGPSGKLPAGPIDATIEGRIAWNSLRSSSTFVGFGNGTFRRNEQSIRGALNVPITSRINNFLPQFGELSADGEYTRVHYSDTGALKHYEAGLTWEPVPLVRLRAIIEETDLPPMIQLLGNPVIETPEVRVFDPLTGQTVDVTEITGGNPNLKPEQDKIRRVSALLRLVPKLNLQLNAEYTDTDRRNFVSSLPQASAAVELAFPDRFIRDSNGVLTSVDLRPVNFNSDRERRLRWGFSMNARIGGPAPGTPPAKGTHGPTHPPTYFQLTANHTIVFFDKIVIRPGLEAVNLLSGGAIGIGGGRLRQQADGTAALTHGGLGARIGVSWRGPSSLVSRLGGTADTLRFSPLLLINLRAFTDLHRFLPHSGWAKSLRLSLDVINVTNDRQRVRNPQGDTPLQYQPGYRDPLGRTIEMELRKVF